MNWKVGLLRTDVTIESSVENEKNYILLLKYEAR